MILRLYRAIVHEGQQTAFREFLEQTAIPTLQAQDGMEHLIVGWPHESSPREFSLTMVWRDMDTLKEFTGEGWNEAVVDPDEAHILEATYVSHYNLNKPA